MMEKWKWMAYTSRRILYEWLCYLRSTTTAKSPEIRFVFFAHSRSGSHLFADLLNTHPDVTCVTEHELFLKRKGTRNPYRFIDGVSKRFDSQVFGGKINTGQLERQHVAAGSVIERLAANQWKFIILERKNVLEQVISVQVACQRQRFHDTQVPLPEEMQITLDLPALHRKMQRKIKNNELTQSLLSPYHPLTVTYEDDLLGSAAQQRTADRVFAFLGIESVPVQTKYTKTGVYALADYITNYDELVASLQGTPYAHFLPQATA